MKRWLDAGLGHSDRIRPVHIAAIVALSVAATGCGGPDRPRDGAGDAPGPSGTRSAPDPGAAATADAGGADSTIAAAPDSTVLRVYECGGLEVTLRHPAADGSRAELLLPDRRVELARVASAAGTRYEGDGRGFALSVRSPGGCSTSSSTARACTWWPTTASWR